MIAKHSRQQMAAVVAAFVIVLTATLFCSQNLRMLMPDIQPRRWMPGGCKVPKRWFLDRRSRERLSAGCPALDCPETHSIKLAS